MVTEQLDLNLKKSCVVMPSHVTFMNSLTISAANVRKTTSLKILVGTFCVSMRVLLTSA